ncbi:hypothetical protein ILUMI_06987 [Ignelater luminosus]|uniref:Odorant receptor n=1 Tax=Ignelater luminosus TaxID=2038154 RepID=A0A8K0D4P6_IGNLU|nr:hypothetical protein ILUMI_06987 [Ignelater luminosus]
MRKFNAEENLSLIIKLLTIVGTWPKNSATRMYQIRGFTTVVILISGIVLTTETVIKFADVHTVSFAMCCLLTLLNTIVKYFFIFIKKKHLLNLIEELNHPVLSLHDDHLYLFLEKKMKIIRFFQNGFLLSGLGTGILILISPVFSTTSKRPIPIPFFVEIEEREYMVYSLAWLFEICAIMLTCLSVCCFDGVTFFFVAIASTELEILSEKIMEAVNVFSVESKNEKVEYKFDKKVNDLLEKCVIQHIAIERKLKEKTTDGCLNLFRETGSFLRKPCNGTASKRSEEVVPNAREIMENNPDTSVRHLSKANGCTALCSHLLNGYRSSEKVLLACYMSQWVHCGPLVCKSLSIIMERAKRPMILYAGGFVTLSLETLVSLYVKRGCKVGFHRSQKPPPKWNMGKWYKISQDPLKENLRKRILSL